MIPLDIPQVYYKDGTVWNGDTENLLNKPLSGVYEVFDRLKTDKNRARIALPLYEGDTAGEEDTVQNPVFCL